MLGVPISLVKASAGAAIPSISNTDDNNNILMIMIIIIIVLVTPSEDSTMFGRRPLGPPGRTSARCDLA